MKFIKPGFGLLLAAFLIFMGLQKFGAANPVFSHIAESSGLAFFEPQVRMLTGVLEILAAALLLVGVRPSSSFALFPLLSLPHVLLAGPLTTFPTRIQMSSCLQLHFLGVCLCPRNFFKLLCETLCFRGDFIAVLGSCVPRDRG